MAFPATTPTGMIPYAMVSQLGVCVQPDNAHTSWTNIICIIPHSIYFLILLPLFSVFRINKSKCVTFSLHPLKQVLRLSLYDDAHRCISCVHTTSLTTIQQEAALNTPSKVYVHPTLFMVLHLGRQLSKQRVSGSILCPSRLCVEVTSLPWPLGPHSLYTKTFLKWIDKDNNRIIVCFQFFSSVIHAWFVFYWSASPHGLHDDDTAHYDVHPACDEARQPLWSQSRGTGNWCLYPCPCSSQPVTSPH